MFLIQKLEKLKTKYHMLNVVNKTDYNAKISSIEKKCFITSDYNKYTSEIFDAKIKEKVLVAKSKISNLVKNSDLSTKLPALAKTVEIMKLKAFDSNFKVKVILKMMVHKVI